jgi:hypothetical protein
MTDREIGVPVLHLVAPYPLARRSHFAQAACAKADLRWSNY